MNNRASTQMVFFTFLLLFFIATASFFAYNSLNHLKGYDKNNNEILNQNINDLKISLMNDEDFIKLVKMQKLDEKDYASMIIGMLPIMDFNDFKISGLDYKISRKNFNLAFFELYGISLDKIKLASLLRLKTIKEVNDELIINLDAYPKGDNLVLIGIDTIKSSHKGLVADVTVYEFYTNDSEVETKIIFELEKSTLKNEKLSDSLIDEYKINVQNKRVVFKENNNSKYFQYQLVSINEIEENGDIIDTELLIGIYVVIGVVLLLSTAFIYIKVKNSNI